MTEHSDNIERFLRREVRFERREALLFAAKLDTVIDINRRGHLIPGLAMLGLIELRDKLRGEAKSP